MRFTISIGELNLMRERQKFGTVLALLAAVFAVLFILQATKTEGRVMVEPPMPGDAKTTFDAQCAKCHGRDGRARTTRGRLSHARDMTDASWQNEVSDERLFNSITKGKGKKMPAYGKKLSEDQIDALVRYVRQLKR
jgi:mono/diheme cytochrome c family protein